MTEHHGPHARPSTRHRVGALAAIAVLALVAAACGGSTPEESAGGGGEGGGGEGGGGEGGGGGELVFAIGGADARQGGTHSQVVDLWNEQNPDTPVRIEILPDQADEQREALALDLQAQTGEFDILAMDVIWTGEFAVNGWAESLEDVRGEIEEVVLPGPFESATWEGTLWAAPYNSNAGFLYYRSDLIDAAPTTWDETREVCTAAAEEAGIAPFVGQGAQYEGMVVNYLEYFWGAGGELISEDGAESLYGEGDAAQRSLEFMRSAQEEGFYAPGFNQMQEEEARAEFQSGNAACMRNWPYAYTLMSGEGEEAEETQVAGMYDIAPIPTFDGGVISALGGFNLGVSAFSENKEAAKEFVLWASTNEEVQTLLGERSLPPVLESAYEALSDDPVMAQLAEILPEARPRPPAPSWSSISEDIQQNVFPAYNGEMPVEEAITSLQEAIQQDLGA